MRESTRHWPPEDAARRARLTIGASRAVLVSQIVGVAYSVATSLWLPAVVMAIAAPLLAVVPRLQARMGTVVAANVVCGALFGTVGVICIADRGVETPLIAGNVAVCMIATVLAGGRWGMAWAAIAILQVWGLALAGAAGIAFEPLLDATGQRWNSAVVTSVLIGTVAAISVFYDVLHLRAVTELDASRRVAERANAAKSRFVANMSHEIRTPLGGLMGAAELMRDTELTEEQRDLVETVDACALALKGLVDDVLDLGRIDAGRLEITLNTLQLPQLISGVVAAHRATAAQKGISLLPDLGADVPTWIRSDPLRLRQVLHNLVGNALKFTEHGTVWLRVRAVGERLRVAIEDTGPGIPETRLDAIFQAFTQADASTTRRYGGSGLGLAISSELVSLLGGTLRGENREEGGARFWFELPLVRAMAPAAGEASDDTDFPGLRVLVVDDAEVNRMVARMMLERLGCAVEVAQDGQQALDVLAAGRFGVVFLDCQMPVMDGFTAARRIRAGDTDTPDIPIIALTALATDADRADCRAAGMDDIVCKPMTADDLRAALARVLDQPSAS